MSPTRGRALVFLLALTGLAVGARAARAQTATALAFEGFELAESRFGPPKAEPVFTAGERIWLRGTARGLGADDRGELVLGIGAALDRPAAEVAPRETIRARDAFAARALPIAVSFPVGGAATAGEHELVLVVEDRTRGARAVREVKIRLAAPDGPTPLNPYFAADPDGEIERPGEFRVGETVRLFFGVVGLAPLAKKVRLEGDLEVREVATGETVSRSPKVLALEGGAQGGVPALDAQIAATATRPGRFLFRVIIHDRNAKKDAVLEREAVVRP
jgi:hypothetical protein